MSDTVAVDPSAPPLAADVAAPVPCERCGTFVQGAPVKVWTQKVCESCATLLRQEVQLYPYGYILGVGILGNFALAAILCALNWKRLGDTSRMRNAIVMSVIGGAWVAFMLIKDIQGGGCFVNLIGSVVASQGLKEVWEEHKKAGGARANLVWPVVLGVGGILSVAFVIGVGLYLAGYDV
jgi:hypothetical protein